jgi:hypothetical protein
MPFNENLIQDMSKKEEKKKGLSQFDPESGKVNLKDFKNPFRNEEDEEKPKKDFKTLVAEDLNSEFKQLKEKVDRDEEKLRISKMTKKPLEVDRKEQDEKLRKTATILGRLWQLTPGQKNHWYRQLKREEKEVAKQLIKL